MRESLSFVDASERRMGRLDHPLGDRLTALLSEMPEGLPLVPNWEDMPEVGREIWSVALEDRGNSDEAGKE